MEDKNLRATLICILATTLGLITACNMWRTDPYTPFAIIHTANTNACLDPSGSGESRMGGVLARLSYLSNYRQSLNDEGLQVHEEDTRSIEMSKDSQKSQNFFWRRNDQIPEAYILVDSGSFSINSKQSGFKQTLNAAREMESMGYSVVNLGIQEMMIKQEHLLDIVNVFSNTKVISANVTFKAPVTGEDCSSKLNRKLKQYYRTKIGNQDIVITGVVSTSSISNDILENSGMRVRNPSEAVKNVLKKTNRNDFVILLGNGLNASEIDELFSLGADNNLQPILVYVGFDACQFMGKVYEANEKQPVPFGVLLNGQEDGRDIGRAEMQRNDRDSIMLYRNCIDALIN